MLTQKTHRFSSATGSIVIRRGRFQAGAPPFCARSERRVVCPPPGKANRSGNWLAPKQMHNMSRSQPAPPPTGWRSAEPSSVVPRSVRRGPPKEVCAPAVARLLPPGHRYSRFHLNPTLTRKSRKINNCWEKILYRDRRLRSKLARRTCLACLIDSVFCRPLRGLVCSYGQFSPRSRAGLLSAARCAGFGVRRPAKGG